LGGGDDDDDDDDQGVQLVPYEEDDHQETDGRDDDDGRDVQVSDGEPELQRKRPRKWFEDASDDEDGRPPGHRKKQGRHADGDDQPQTLEDLEAMAAGLLAKS
jgi:ATP-dependent RNA helicase DDX10/DBP4